MPEWVYGFFIVLIFSITSFLFLINESLSFSLIDFWDGIFLFDDWTCFLVDPDSDPCDAGFIDFVVDSGVFNPYWWFVLRWDALFPIF